VSGQRWGVGRWLAVWAPVMGAQVWLAFTYGAASPGGVALAVAMLQLAKIPATRGRLLDLGRPSDDLVYLLPPLGLVLLFQCFFAAPRDDVRQRRMRTWDGRPTALDAWREGLKRVAATFPAVGVSTILVAVVGAVVVELIGGVLGSLVPSEVAGAAPGQGSAALEQGLVITIGFVGLYTAVQYGKRARASRGSWWLSLLLLPSLLLWAAVRFQGQKGQLGVLLANLPHDAANLFVAPVFGGLLVALWVGAAQRKPDGSWPSGSEAWAVARARWWDAGAVWGGRAQATWLGMQVLILGIWFAVSYALADLLAVSRPAEPSFTRSTELVRGQRSRVFKVLTVWFYLAVIVLRTVVLVPFVGLDVVFNSLMVPQLLSAQLQAGVSVVGWLTGWACAMAMLVVLEDREAVLAAREAAEGSNAAVAG
jgi:hypothetical protein